MADEEAPTTDVPLTTQATADVAERTRARDGVATQAPAAERPATRTEPLRTRGFILPAPATDHGRRDLVYILNLSRALLAGGKSGALAIGVDRHRDDPLRCAALISSRPRMRTSTLVMLVSVLFLLVIVSGLTTIGPSEEKESAATGFVQPTGKPVDTLSVTALPTIKFNSTAYTVKAGIVRVNYIDGGGDAHTGLRLAEVERLRARGTGPAPRPARSNSRPASTRSTAPSPGTGRRDAGHGNGHAVRRAAPPGRNGSPARGRASSPAAAVTTAAAVELPATEGPGAGDLRIEADNFFFKPDTVPGPAGIDMVDARRARAAHHTLVFDGVLRTSMLKVDGDGVQPRGEGSLRAGEVHLLLRHPRASRAGMEGTFPHHVTARGHVARRRHHEPERAGIASSGAGSGPTCSPLAYTSS